ncbi:uncharacterized protein C2845_PM11G18760 [Panicum miliaceum]|uniref:Sarcoplasmic reticulum histidine-rich calcium-binding protein-like n=1 Tax=Panicum miliaceum TaxID=4540 RepID=A0A3L6RR04_PANMI|nr:uncharacterized protein C2845_PM11G18760 [Panicum miliaceum]
MARRLSSTAALVLLVLSLLAVAHCRHLEADPESAGVVAAGDDENGPPNPTLPAEVVLPAEQQQKQQHGFLRLPSHRFRHYHRPCRHGLFQRHLWWVRHYGAFGEDAPRRFHRHGEALSHSHLLRVSPGGETGEVKAVAEPDPDRSLPDSDGDEVVAASREPPFGDAREEAAHEDEGAAVRAWRKEMQRRWWLHHHGMRLHRHHRDEEEEAAEGLKRFHHHHHHHDEDEDKHAMRKRFRRADDEHDDESDSEDEDEEVEELVRRFRKAIMRRRSGSGHGRRFHHHHHYGHHRHAEEAEKAGAAQEEGGVVSWIKDLIMNRF